jgi:hypothetical protein
MSYKKQELHTLSEHLSSPGCVVGTVYCHFRYGYFAMVNQIVMTTVELCSDDFNPGAT